MGSLSLVLEKAPKLFPPPPRSSSGLEECVWKERTEFPRGIKTRAFFFFFFSGELPKLGPPGLGRLGSSRSCDQIRSVPAHPSIPQNRAKKAQCLVRGQPWGLGVAPQLPVRQH